MAYVKKILLNNSYVSYKKSSCTNISMISATAALNSVLTDSVFTSITAHIPYLSLYTLIKRFRLADGSRPVSYTHLTLPTKA